jgi:hypothetical protein
MPSEAPARPLSAGPPAAARWPLLVAAAVVALAFVEAGVALVAPALAPTDAQWQAAARQVRAGFRAGDLIVAAPAWADPLLRLHLGDLIPVAVAGRLDDARYGRVWEVSQRGAHAPEAARGAVVEEQRFGALTLRRVERAPAVVTYDFLSRAAEARVTRTEAGLPDVACPWAGDRHQCPEGFLFARLQTVEVDTHLRHALLTQPVGGATVVIEYPAVTLGRELVVATGLHDVWARKAAHGEVDLRVVVAGVPAATIVSKNETGWLLTRVDTAAQAGRTAPVRFEVTSPAPAARHFALAAEARQ